MQLVFISLAILGNDSICARFTSASPGGIRCHAVGQISNGNTSCNGTGQNHNIEGLKSAFLIVKEATGEPLTRSRQLYRASGNQVMFRTTDNVLILTRNGTGEPCSCDTHYVLECDASDYYDCVSRFDKEIGFNGAEGGTKADKPEEVLQHL